MHTCNGQATNCPNYGYYCYVFDKVAGTDLALADFERDEHDLTWIIP